MGIIYFVLFASVFVILIQNYYSFTQPLTLQIFHITIRGLPIGIWFLLVFSAGFLIGYLRAVPSQVKAFSRGREIEKLKKKIEELEVENQMRDEKIKALETEISSYHQEQIQTQPANQVGENK
jgi:uncharacterized integral membrane protein